MDNQQPTNGATPNTPATPQQPQSTSQYAAPQPNQQPMNNAAPQPFYDGQQPQQYQQQPQQYQQQPQPYAYPQQQQYAAAPIEDNSTMFIVFSIIEIVMGGLLAIVPLVYSIKFKDAMKMNDFAGAISAHHTAKIWLIVMLVLIIVIFVVAFAVGFLGAISGQI